MIALVTLLVLEAVLQLAFPHLPAAIIQQMPQYRERLGFRLDTEHGAREYPAHQRVDFEVSAHSGDLYSLTCLSDSDAPVFEPYRVSYTRDAHGFRNAEPWKPEDLDLVILGDSFTAAESIREPYWQGLSDSMLVLGLPGSGTLEQQNLFAAYALPRQPEMVILAYFAGNDLRDNQDYEEMRSAGQTFADRAHQRANPLEYSVLFHLLMFLRSQALSEDCHYPQIAETNPPSPIAFYDDFLPLLALDKATLQASEMFRLTYDSISEMAKALDTRGAKLVLLYIPQKAELYWRYLSVESKNTIVSALPKEELSITVKLIDANLRVQRDLMREVSAQLGLDFIDLTSALAEAISQGQSPYFFADTHWNQDGHNIARKTLLDFLNGFTLDS